MARDSPITGELRPSTPSYQPTNFLKGVISMTKKIKSVEELLEKIDINKLKSVGVNSNDIAKVEALHDLLKHGQTWNDEEVQQLFGVLPDSFPYCTAYIHTEILVKIGKAKAIKIIARPGIKDSRLKWIPIEKADQFNVPASLPIIGYEIICAQCHQTFIGKEPFHQNFCSKCVNRKTPDIKIEAEPKPESAQPEIPEPSTMIEPVVSFEKKPDKPKRKGRSLKSAKDTKPAKQTTKRPPQKSRKKGESKKRKK